MRGGAWMLLLLLLLELWQLRALITEIKGKKSPRQMRHKTANWPRAWETI